MNAFGTSSGGRWAFSGICSKKVTLSLKPHQMGMTENQGLCSKARWVAPKQVRPSLRRCPFYFGLVGGCWSQSRGNLTRDYPVRGSPGLVLQGSGRTPRYGDLGPVLWQVVPQCLVISWKSIFPTRPYGFDCAQLLVKREMQAFQLDAILLSIDTIITSDGFDKKIGYRKVKTRHVYLWHGLTRCFFFQRILKL